MEGDVEGAGNTISLIFNAVVSVSRSSISFPPNFITSAAMDNITKGETKNSALFHFGSIYTDDLCEGIGALLEPTASLSEP